MVYAPPTREERLWHFIIDLDDGDNDNRHIQGGPESSTYVILFMAIVPLDDIITPISLGLYWRLDLE